MTPQILHLLLSGYFSILYSESIIILLYFYARNSTQFVDQLELLPPSVAIGQGLGKEPMVVAEDQGHGIGEEPSWSQLLSISGEDTINAGEGSTKQTRSLSLEAQFFGFVPKRI